jgi:hypothetical protein
MDEVIAYPKTKEISIIDVIERSSCVELDRMEALLGTGAVGDVITCPIVNRFTNGLYTREIFMAAGTKICSKIHKTQHQFIISKGKVSVWCKDTGWTTYTAPYHGITEPGARRFLYIHEDTVWTTFHPNPDNLEDEDKLLEFLILPHSISTIEDFGGSIETLLTSIPLCDSNHSVENNKEISV